MFNLFDLFGSASQKQRITVTSRSAKQSRKVFHILEVIQPKERPAVIGPRRMSMYQQFRPLHTGKKYRKAIR